MTGVLFSKRKPRNNTNSSSKPRMTGKGRRGRVPPVVNPLHRRHRVLQCRSRIRIRMRKIIRVEYQDPSSGARSHHRMERRKKKKGGVVVNPKRKKINKYKIQKDVRLKTNFLFGLFLPFLFSWPQNHPSLSPPPYRLASFRSFPFLPSPKNTP